MDISYNPLEIVYRNFDDVIVLYNLRIRQILTLENVASDIWAFIAKERITTCKSVLNYIASLYEIDVVEIQEDIEQFIKELFEAGVILIDNAYAVLEETNADATDANEDFEGKIIQMMQEKNQIYSATFELTYACNEKCIHCYANYPAGSNKMRLLNLEDCKAMIDELYDMKCMHIAFTGGDPFMFKGFEELFEYTRKKGFVCDIYTNAQYIADHPKTLGRFLQLIPRVFYISLYGSTSEVHDGITTISGSFEKTIKAIKSIKKAGIPVVINVMILKNNYHQLQDILVLAKELGVEYRVGMSIIYKNDGCSGPMDYFINDKVIIKQILSTVRENAYSIDVALGSNKENKYICGAGTTAISISPNGIVYPCISLKTPLGNAFDETLCNIWNSEKRIDLINSLVWDNTKECNDCNVKKECPHCIGISQAEYGDYYSCNTCDKIIAECLSEINAAKIN